MDEQSIRKQVIETLLEVAPDLGEKTLEEKANLRDTYDLDSADFLSFLRGLHQRLGVDVPTSAYQHCTSIAATISYITEITRECSTAMPSLAKGSHD
jgi:acyl carrier protein